MADLDVDVGIVLVGIVPVSVVSGTASIAGKLVLRYLGWLVGPGSIFDQQTVVVSVGTLQIEYFSGKENLKLRRYLLRSTLLGHMLLVGKVLVHKIVVGRSTVEDKQRIVWTVIEKAVRR